MRIDTDMNLSEPTQSLVSVLIRVRNEEHALRRLFECLHIQKLDRPFEVVVIDNESDDGSAKVAMAMGARVFTFPRSLFGYGRAINVGVKLCRGDLIVLLSAHSWPQGDDWLSRMVNCVEGRGVAAPIAGSSLTARSASKKKRDSTYLRRTIANWIRKRLCNDASPERTYMRSAVFPIQPLLFGARWSSVFRSGTCRSRKTGRSSWIA
ncbi:MAG TPA: glycosyltransferase family A protein [Candidatus Dormibacteraeota bacterium]|nr:glycosyltransferase family A protein [Candidatus Dormibacteraeota bacterium]